MPVKRRRGLIIRDGRLMDIEEGHKVIRQNVYFILPDGVQEPTCHVSTVYSRFLDITRLRTL
jgi:hypothetical protein